MEVIELKKLFSNPDIQNMELKDLIEMINYKDFDVLLDMFDNLSFFIYTRGQDPLLQDIYFIKF